MTKTIAPPRNGAERPFRTRTAACVLHERASYIVGNNAGVPETASEPVIVALPRAGLVTTLLGAVGTAVVIAEPPPTAPTRNHTVPVSVSGTPVGSGPHVPLNVFWNETLTMS